MTGASRGRRWIGRLLRLAGLLVVVGLVARMVHWHDRVEGPHLPGGRLEGRIERVLDDRVRLRPLEGPVQEIPLAPDEAGVRPTLAYGLSSVGRRLGDRPAHVVLVLVGMLLLVALTAWRWHALVLALGLMLSRPRALGLTWIGGFFNLAVPGSTGGDVVKAWYAARATGRGPPTVLTVFVDRVIGLLGLILLAALVLMILRPAGAGHDAARRIIVITGALSVLGAVLVLVRPLRRALGLGRLVRRLPLQGVLQEMHAGLVLYRRRPLVLCGSLGLSLINHAGIALAVAALADALGIEGAGIAACLAVVPIANLLSAIPLAPGGWGVGEWAFATFLAPYGVPATEAVTLSIVYRFMTLVANLPGGALWASWRQPVAPDKIRAEVEAAAHEAATLTREDPPHA
jgi:uncharacterized membrane protein YbhN (UPF0104 family)